MTYPTISPKLTLDFANSRQLGPRITFSRSSSATYVHPDTGLVTTAPDGVARFEKEGLLIEEARTNLVRTSTPTGSGFSNGWSQRASTTITTNADVAPDGTTTATSVVADVGSTDYAYTDGNLASATTADCAVSAFAKPINNMPSVVLKAGISDGGAVIWNFNFQTGATTLNFETGGATGFGSTAFMEPLANGWFRVGFTAPAGTNDIVVNARESWGGSQPAGDGVTGCLWWGCQIEEGDFQTSFIPTAGSTVTRAADVASITGTNFSSWWKQDQGTLGFDFNSFGREFVQNCRVLYLFSSTTSGNTIDVTTGTKTSQGIIIKSGGASEVQLVTRKFLVNGKHMLGLKEDDFALAQNGETPFTDTSGLMPVDVNELRMTYSNIFLNGHFSRLSYYDRRVSDAALQALTS